MAASVDLGEVLDNLEDKYGPTHTPRRSPLAWLLYESASYLVDDERRERVLRTLEKKTALDPKKIERLSEAVLRETIEEGGMLLGTRAAKVRECARLANEMGGGELSSLLELPIAKASSALKKFPGIGEPGADFILLACGVATRPSVDSNGLRVLQRLGIGKPTGGYAAQYRSAIEVLDASLPTDPAARVRARELLRRHGQEICRRTAPACAACSLATRCPSANRAAPSE